MNTYNWQMEMEMSRIGFVSTLVMMLFTLALAADYDLVYHDTFEHGAQNWQPLFPDNWRVVEQDGKPVYELAKVGEAAPIRKPCSMSILTPIVVGSFELQVKAKCYTDPATVNRDLCLFFGYQDDVHFYYAHFAGNSDAVHNAIHIVNNADRAKINTEPAGESKALLKEIKWYTLTVKRNVEAGTIEAFVDGELVLTAVDTTFTSGKIGIGSFDDTGAFKEVKLWGELVQTKVGRHDTQPADFWLGQNYPNPFNPSTFIEYHLPTDDYVSLAVYDVVGREVSSLVNRHQQAGYHSILFEPRNRAAGLYYYKLSTTTDSDVKKMVLVN